MSSLTFAKPPAPNKATHEAELDAAVQEISPTFAHAVVGLITKMCFPHSEWWIALANSVSGHQVTATSVNAADANTAAQYTAGTGNTPIASQARKKNSATIVSVRDDDPYTVQRFYDWTLENSHGTTLALPQPVTEPSGPGKFPIRSVQLSARYVEEQSEFFAKLLEWAVKLGLRSRFIGRATRFRWGTATAIHTASKTATVKLDSEDGSDDPPPVDIAWGTRAWTRSMLVGKRVRVVVASEGTWIDDTDEASGTL